MTSSPLAAIPGSRGSSETTSTGGIEAPAGRRLGLGDGNHQRGKCPDQDSPLDFVSRSTAAIRPAAAEWSLEKIEAAVVIVWAYVQELAAGGVSEPARACLLDEMESFQAFMALSRDERTAVHAKIEVLRARARCVSAAPMEPKMLG